MKTKKLTNSVRKHIRKEKAKIRLSISDTAGRKEKTNELYKGVATKAKK